MRFSSIELSKEHEIKLINLVYMLNIIFIIPAKKLKRVASKKTNLHGSGFRNGQLNPR